MKNKGILKFRSELSRGAMHYITFNDKKVSLTQKDSRKVEFLKTHNTLEIATNLLSRNFDTLEIKVIDDESYTKEVFDFMLQEKHTHYKKDYKDLVVLQYV